MIFMIAQRHASNNTSIFLASLCMADLLFLLLYIPLDLWRQAQSWFAEENSFVYEMLLRETLVLVMQSRLVPG